jgi:pimeloyl-ACP methyl ester carboxylesterase
MHCFRAGSGQPLLLLHGLGGSWKSWAPVLDGLVASRDVIAPDLPGFGATPELAGETSISALADAVTEFLRKHRWLGIDAVGSSMGARLVLELARRGAIGTAVALDPVGFWRGWQRHFFYASISVSIKLARLLQPAMRFLTLDALARTALFAQLSARPWRLPPKTLLTEMRSYAAATRFDELLRHLAYGEEQKGMKAEAMNAPIIIGWGRKDRVCPPEEAQRAQALFPGAHVYWFEQCGHFPMWDAPEETLQLIIASTGGAPEKATGEKSPRGRRASRDEDVLAMAV